MSVIRVLIVEDEQIFARDLRRQLEGLNYDVISICITGEEAIDRTHLSRPDLVLMDIRLKGEMDGVEAARRIQEQYEIPVIFLTAYSDDHTLQRAKISQPFGYLLKPFNANELHATIQMSLYKHRMEMKLKKTIAELERSNRDLEQFAYVASHDLQEPLRMVASYTQLLERRCGEQLSQEGKEFMQFIIDGARRMQGQIDDLLAYSRVRTRAQPFEQVSLDSVIEEVMANLDSQVRETRARIEHESLPAVMADRSQLVSLQNLVSNALKFRGSDPPRVSLSAEQEGTHWHVRIRDNGIGIDPQHHQRIFDIFQRLHTREQYPGSGIGLALCRRIVQGHGGEIWVESEPGSGATFHFTLPSADRESGDARE